MCNLDIDIFDLIIFVACILCCACFFNRMFLHKLVKVANDVRIDIVKRMRVSRVWHCAARSNSLTFLIFQMSFAKLEKLAPIYGQQGGPSFRQWIGSGEISPSSASV